MNQHEDEIYREKLWYEGERQIFLNQKEDNSFFEIMTNYLELEFKNFSELDSDDWRRKEHIFFDLINVLNGLQPSHKNEILRWIDDEVKSFLNSTEE